MVKFLLAWLRPSQRRASIAVRPSRTLELPIAYDVTFERCKRAVVELLGAVVREDDRSGGYIESSAGLMFSERICFLLKAIDPERTRVTVESRRIAGSQLPPQSSHIAAVAEYLLRA
ncbi:MAG: hypothetical protein M3160_07820 [Candidatus Eremiobacteraeota bacterium]|nr:hypothetical protein [Candidatus Eremiobacteraeota bacterium]